MTPIPTDLILADRYSDRKHNFIFQLCLPPYKSVGAPPHLPDGKNIPG
jgi:hypothetical protein